MATNIFNAQIMAAGLAGGKRSILELRFTIYAGRRHSSIYQKQVAAWWKAPLLVGGHPIKKKSRNS
jgi:hypothetical protein